MSEIINKYNNGVIYTIECNDINLKYIYVGSTINFKKRETDHKNVCRNINSKQYTQKLYQIINENGGWDSFTMKILEVYPCNCKEELLLRERFWFESLEANMNTKYPQRTKKESSKIYNKINIEKIALYQKSHYEINKEKLLLNNKSYRELNEEKIKKTCICFCGKNIQKREKNRHEKTKFHINFICNSNSNI